MELFVSNLHWSIDAVELRQLFEVHGRVDEAKVIYDPSTGRSKGFGFVQMPDRAQAGHALAIMHCSSIEGRQLRVEESEPRVSARQYRRRR